MRPRLKTDFPGESAQQIAEKALHEQVVNYLRLRGFKVYSYFKGINPVRVYRCEKCGHSGKLAPKKTPVFIESGVPDLLCIHRRTKWRFWMELKRKGKKPEPHQLAEQEDLRSVGEEVVWFDNFDSILEYVNNGLGGTR